MIIFENFGVLNPDGRRATLRLLEMSQQQEDIFISFALRWMSFNGWMSCVTNRNSDREMVEALSENERMVEAFASLIEDRQFAQSLMNFTSFWPIFNSQHIRSNLGPNFSSQFGSRAQLTAAVINDPTISRRPIDWRADKSPNWKDTLTAIYQVRCNMFHGAKSPLDLTDRELVELSNSLLGTFIAASLLQPVDATSGNKANKYNGLKRSNLSIAL